MEVSHALLLEPVTFKDAVPPTVQHPSRKRSISFMCSLTEDAIRPPDFANPTAAPNG